MRFSFFVQPHQVGFQLSKEAINNVLKSRSLVETFLEDKPLGVRRDYWHRQLRHGRHPRRKAGVSRGLRPHARIIAPLCSRDLQYNIIRSHAAGVGNPLSPARTRMLLALRINVLAKGYSGISLNTLQGLIDAFNGI
jgi:hypothetical protein